MQLTEALELVGQAGAVCPQTLLDLGVRARQSRQAHPVQQGAYGQIGIERQDGHGLRGLDTGLECGLIRAELGERRARSFQLRGDRGRCGGRSFHAVWLVSSGYHSRYGRLQQVRLRNAFMTRYSSKSWRTFRPRTAAAQVAPVSIRLVARDCRVLGLDPGSQRTGYGIIDCRGSGERHVASGCVDVIGHDMVVRLQRIYAAVSALVAEHRPDTVAIERVFVHRNPDSALKLGQARGVALCAAASLGASVHEYAPRAIKMAVTGYGAAAKPQVAQMVRTLLLLEIKLAADAADALAVALCHAQTRRLGALDAVDVA